ncbi:MAG TPA: NAD(P)H-hydrate dehydratase [Actinocrinis sp.]|uniref:NAD(P)H-hydrate dehydratase n=1 Tax=Actinocrinis sp. TaxID=1920516 RepID=UPI002DDD8C22|nr:NAD(P)H-hydrate dehydratase [Actinocrinis sp.]HEV2346957.1 NAD(P)H-hydrate dehydratase [Actinocrinis sp.]
MRRAYSVEAIRHAEAELMARLPDGALMQRAAAGLATVAARILRESGGVYGARVTLLVGVGDNGGDALYAGVLLARRAVRVDAILLDPGRVHGGGLAALRDAGGRIGDLAALERTDLIIDGLLGIGGKGALRAPASDLAEAAAASGAPVLAVDLPSGIDADTGQVSGTAIRAHVTVTFGAYKPGLLIDPAAERAGVVEFVDIGLSALPPQPAVDALQVADVAALLPRPAHTTDKYGRGVVGVACGSVQYPGAGVLAVGGALRAGCGAIRYSGPREVSADILRRWPEILVVDALPAEVGRVQAWVCGSGLPADDAYSAERTRQVIESGLPTVLDAGALNYVHANVGTHCVLTPHAGEAARLLGVARADVETQRLDSVRRLADTFGATVLLKGSTTLVAEPGGSTVRANPTGTPALATAGSGDVLAGLIGGLLAAGLGPLDAASVGAYLHGMAGRAAGDSGTPISAGDLLAAIPQAWHNLQT